MLYQLLTQYIENQLYTSIDEVHEKIVIYHAVGDLTDGELTALFNLLFPTVEEEINEEVMLLQDTQATEIKQNPMPQRALEILTEMSNANIFKNEAHKLGIYVQLGQLTEAQYEAFIPSDTPTILPEVEDEVIENAEVAVASLSVDTEVASTKKARKARKK